MPTKAELEARVAELEKTTDASLREQNAKLVEEIADLKQLVEMQTKIANDATDALVKSVDVNNTREEKISQMSSEINGHIKHIQELSQVVQDEVVHKKSCSEDGDHVIYLGKKYKIVLHNSVKGLCIDDFKKHYVNELLTAIVIDREGD